MGVRPLAEHRRVGNEAAVLAPQMELVAGRFEHEPQRRVRREAEAELGGRARRGAGDRDSKAAVDRAVQMAAEDALDLQMAGDDRSERLAVLQTGPVQALDAGREGWMVHHQQDRSRWRRRRNDRRRRWRMTLARNRKFADSPVERDGFENSVPREISSGFEASAELRPIVHWRGGIIRAVVGLGKPIELLRWLEEPSLTSNEGAHADGGGGHRGTGISNPSLSGEESANFRFLAE